MTSTQATLFLDLTLTRRLLFDQGKYISQLCGKPNTFIIGLN